MILKSFTGGAVAALILLLVYFTILSLVSGFGFAKDQFSSFWYFVVSLSVGFGVQVGLYSYLKSKVKEMASKKVLAVSGTTSTAAMIACCTHYLANILPFLGTAGIVAFVAQYQVEIFYVGLLFNILGIAYVSWKIIQFKEHENKSPNSAVC